ncbi:MAG: polysaccharide deacetylase family protein [Planctomycetes bacterium]|nr:polysaccharide deacetylase family protein [Planctomycetota bacterium]
MASICFYFQVHQPYRLRRYSVFDADPNYFDEYANADLCRKVARRCYLPTNRLMLDLLRRHPEFAVSYSITGVALEQFEQWAPEVVDSFRALVDTGRVELLAETFYHSLAFLYSREEFREQILSHSARMQETFGVRPRVFRNTELIYNNDLAHFIESLGFTGVVAEGADHILGYRSPAFVYRPAGTKRLSLLLKHYRLSDDIAFRFSDRNWPEWPLKAETFADWVDQVNGNGYVVNLFMDYETFGEHQWEDSGIFDFMYHLPDYVLRSGKNNFKTLSQAVAAYEPEAELDIPHMISWADMERDLSAWLGNAMQSNALHELYRLEEPVKAAGDPQLLHDWRRLQTSDHFYYMCTKWFADGDVHKYFNPYESPYDSYINFMNVLDNIRARLKG